eukprot:TRINITY_DN395_c0_g1_i2.p1 TRINITY_DN395_c0_g1~~TRINITY_DN395_c0_g1_i2.p1  ORF type:complete len:474 (-),score=7.66 TRINITY_DN395_c0_g1_i2:323-1744(-)
MTTRSPSAGNHCAGDASVLPSSSTACETEPPFPVLPPPPAVPLTRPTTTTTTTTTTTHGHAAGIGVSNTQGGGHFGIVPKAEEDVEESPFVPLKPAPTRRAESRVLPAFHRASDSLPPPYRQAVDMNDGPLPSISPVTDLRTGHYQLDASSHHVEPYTTMATYAGPPTSALPGPSAHHGPSVQLPVPPPLVPHYPPGLSPPVAPFLVPLAPRDSISMPPSREQQDVPHYMLYKPQNGQEVHVPWDLGIALMPSTVPRDMPPAPPASAHAPTPTSGTTQGHYPPPLPPGVPSAPGMPGPPGPWLQGLSSHHMSMYSDIGSDLRAQQELAKQAAQKKARTCNLCGKAFSSPFNCRVHIRTFHNKERKFHCKLCPSKFGIKSHLTIHVQATHSGKRPFACTICPSTFARKYSLQLHVRTVHAAHKESDKPKARTLKSRATQVTKQFPCRECGKVFLRKDVTLRHERGVHKLGVKKT